tara:strand:- start:16683 stop:16919 length:237 start_codon:yes stop_codon:yes gene_type:complete
MKANLVILIDMTPATFEQHRHTGINHAIHDLKPVTPLANHADLSKALKLIRDGLDGHPSFVCEVAHAELLSPNQSVEQ